MTCPHLDYRREGDGRSFTESRAYCEVAGRFVQPLRADLCADRYALDHERDCEVYREHAGLTDGGAVDDGGDGGTVTDADADGGSDGVGATAGGTGDEDGGDEP